MIARHLSEYLLKKIFHNKDTRALMYQGIIMPLLKQIARLFSSIYKCSKKTISVRLCLEVLVPINKFSFVLK